MVVCNGGVAPMTWSARVMVWNAQAFEAVRLPVPVVSLPLTGSTKYVGAVPVTASQVVQMPPPVVPPVSDLQVALDPQKLVAFAVGRQQFPGTHDPAQHSSPALIEHTVSVAAAAQPVVAGTHVPTAGSPGFVSQTFPFVHCESAVQPPQTFGVAKPQVGVGALQSAFELQSPGMQAPALQTYGVDVPPYADVQPTSGPALVIPLSHAPQASPLQMPLAPAFEHAVPLGHDEASDEGASLTFPSAGLASLGSASSVGEPSLPPASATLESFAGTPASSEATLTSLVASVLPSALPPGAAVLLPPQPIMCIVHAAPASDANVLQKPSGLWTIVPVFLSAVRRSNAPAIRARDSAKHAPFHARCGHSPAAAARVAPPDCRDFR
jgi:hypothetical protein